MPEATWTHALCAAASIGLLGCLAEIVRQALGPARAAEDDGPAVVIVGRAAERR